jgi:hypothetical protein
MRPPSKAVWVSASLAVLLAAVVGGAVAIQEPIRGRYGAP